MKPAAQRYVIGVDVGSQGMKTVLLDASGHIAANASVRIASSIAPNRAHRQAYDDAYALYRDIYASLQEPFRKAAKR